MNISVRYYSKHNHTKNIAEAISEGAGCEDVSITDESTINEYYDLLFIGGAPYANIMSKELRLFVESLSKDLVGKVVLFTTSNWSRRTILAMKKILEEKDITVVEESFYSHMFRVDANMTKAVKFGRDIVEKYSNK